MANRSRFEGKPVVGIEFHIGGSAGDARLNRKLTPGDRVVVVSEGVVKRVGHDLTDTGLVRVQTVKVAEGFVLDDEVDALDLVHKLRRDRKASLDELLGTPPIDGFPDDDKEE